jgi:hypothetical protein
VYVIGILLLGVSIYELVCVCAYVVCVQSCGEKERGIEIGFQQCAEKQIQKSACFNV